MVQYVKISMESQLDANRCAVCLQMLGTIHPNVLVDSFSRPYAVTCIAYPFPAIVSAGAG